jgi:hypothetical protein
MYSATDVNVPLVLSVLLIVILIFAVLPLWFSALVLKKAGLSPWWALISLIPIVNVVMLWVFAYARWPALGDRNPP